MTETIKQALYNNTVEIVFYPNSHQYKRNGKNITSVTSALGMVDKSQALIKWAIGLAENYLLDHLETGNRVDRHAISEACQQHSIRKQEAADIGTLIHDWAEQYALGKNPKLPEDEKVLNGVLAFLKWVDENQIKFLETERIIYSIKHNYVGIMDLVFTSGIENHAIIHVGDYKSSNGIYNTMLYQVAAYQEAFSEEFPDKKLGNAFILRFAKEDKNDQLAGDFEIREIKAEDHPKNFAAFLASLTLKERDKELQAEWRANQK